MAQNHHELGVAMTASDKRPQKVAGPYLGVDGCQGAWAYVALTGTAFEVGKLRHIDQLEELFPQAKAVLLDMPIGLPETTREAAARPEAWLRQQLKGKAASVFSVPCRQAVYEEDRQEAKQINIAVLGKSLSEQSLGLCRAIRQVDSFLQGAPGWKERLMECHPEYAFAVLNGGLPILENKRTPIGHEKRVALLRRYYPQTDDVIRRYLEDLPSRKKLDDVLDALCLAVMARLGGQHGFLSLPNPASEDSKGLKMRIVVAEMRKKR